jgi:hypothetical protein
MGIFKLNHQLCSAKWLTIGLASMVLFATGCQVTTGVQGGSAVLGGSNSASFSGITAANVLSPTAVQINWNASSGYTQYKIFNLGSGTALATSVFSTVTVTGLTPSTAYTFSVGGVNTNGSLFGASNTIPVTTWPNFTGVSSASAASPTSILVSWSFPSIGPTYKVYVNQGSAPTDFTTPDATTQTTSITVSTWGGANPIQQNKTYYVVVRATYLDSTSETNSNSVSVSTPSSINPLPVVSTPNVILGQWPTFAVSNGQAGYSVSFSATGGGQTINLGSISMSGPVASYQTPTSKALPLGANVITPTVSFGGSSVDLATIPIYTRGLSTSFNDGPLMGGGKGNQAFGTTMAVGDFNCDGFDDLAVGAPAGTFFSSDPSTITQGIYNGAVYVFYGSGSGLLIPNGSTVPDPSSSPTGKNPLIITIPTGTPVPLLWGSYGLSLAAGNINGDMNVGGTAHCDDLAIGAPYVSSVGLPYPTYPYVSGAVFLYYGSANGLQLGTPAINSTACLGSSCSPQEILPALVPTDAYGNNSYFQFGTSITIGNFKNDGSGTLDLAVSAPGYNGDAINGTAAAQGVGQGRIFIYHGSTNGIAVTSTTNRGFASRIISAPSGTAALWSTLGSMTGFGNGLAAADMNGDGFDELIVGSPTDTNGGYTNAGKVYFYATSSAEIGNLPAPTSSLTQTSDAGSYGLTNYTFYGGNVVKIGDVNGDGFADIAITNNVAPLGYPSGGVNTVRLLFDVIYGSASGPQLASIGRDTGTPCTGGVCKIQRFSMANSWMQYPGYSAGFLNSFGMFAAAAHAQPRPGSTAPGSGNLPFGGQRLNNDDYADLMIGLPIYAGYNANAPGGAFAFYGSASGLGLVPSIIYPLTTGNNDGTGMSVAIGNFKASQVAAAAVGSPLNSSLSNGAYGGVVYTFQSAAGGLAANVSTYTQLVKSNLSVELGFSGYPNAVIAAGDLNGDGYSDAVATIVQMPIFPGQSSPPATYAAGKGPHPFISSGNKLYSAVVYYGSATGLGVGTIPSMTPVNPKDPLLIGPPSSQCGNGTTQFPCNDWNFGVTVLPVGDVNGDGFSDILIGDWHPFSGLGAQGNSWFAVYFGSGSGIQHAVPPTSTNTGIDPRIVIAAAYQGGYFAASGLNYYYALGAYTYGDFNGDGYSDIAFAYMSDNPPPNNTANGGRVMVVYGSQLGPQSDISQVARCTGAFNSSGTKTWPNSATTQLCAPLVALANPCDGGTPGSCVLQQLNPKPTASYFGAAIANAGDINGDGIDDMVIGAPLDSTAGTNNGAVYIYFGTSRGLAVGTDGQAVVQTPSVPQVYSPVLIAPGRISAGTGRNFGSAVSGAGDINKDGFGDFVVDAYTANGVSTGGGIYAFYGCLANNAGCPNTGIWGVSYGGGTFTTAPYTSPYTNCNAGGNCIVVNKVPCTSGGVCSPQLIPTILSGSGFSGSYNYFGITLGSIGDINQDGYADVVAGTHKMPGPSQGTSIGVNLSNVNLGGAVVYSGSPLGLVAGSANTQPSCDAAGGCTPYLLLGQYSNWGDSSQPEYYYLSGFQNFLGPPKKLATDFNGDGRADFLLQYSTYFGKNRNSHGKMGFILFQ